MLSGNDLLKSADCFTELQNSSLRLEFDLMWINTIWETVGMYRHGTSQSVIEREAPMKTVAPPLDPSIRKLQV